MREKDFEKVFFKRTAAANVTFCGEERQPERRTPHFAKKNAASHKGLPQRGCGGWI